MVNDLKIEHFIKKKPDGSVDFPKTPTIAGNPIGGGAWVKFGQNSPTSGTTFQMTGIPSNAVCVKIVFTGMDFSNSSRMTMKVMDDSSVQSSGYFNYSLSFQASTTAVINTEQSFLEINRINNTDGSSVQSGTGTLSKNGTTGDWVWDVSGFNVFSGTPTQLEWSKTHSQTPNISGTMNGLEFAVESGGTFQAGTVTGWYSVE